MNDDSAATQVLLILLLIIIEFELEVINLITMTEIFQTVEKIEEQHELRNIFSGMKQNYVLFNMTYVISQFTESVLNEFLKNSLD